MKITRDIKDIVCKWKDNLEPIIKKFFRERFTDKQRIKINEAIGKMASSIQIFLFLNKTHIILLGISLYLVCWFSPAPLWHNSLKFLLCPSSDTLLYEILRILENISLAYMASFIFDYFVNYKPKRKQLTYAYDEVNSFLIAIVTRVNQILSIVEEKDKISERDWNNLKKYSQYIDNHLEELFDNYASRYLDDKLLNTLHDIKKDKLLNNLREGSYNLESKENSTSFDTHCRMLEYTMKKMKKNSIYYYSIGKVIKVDKNKKQSEEQ